MAGLTLRCCRGLTCTALNDDCRYVGVLQLLVQLVQQLLLQAGTVVYGELVVVHLLRFTISHTAGRARAAAEGNS